MKVLAYGDGGNKVKFTCRNCKSVIEMYEDEADWFNVAGEMFGVCCPACNCYGEYDEYGSEVKHAGE